MSGSGSVSFGSGLGPSLHISNNPTKSMLGPGGSGWSGSFPETFSGWGKRARYEKVAIRPGPTRTTRTHSTISTGCSAHKPGPNPDPHRRNPDPRLRSRGDAKMHGHVKPDSLARTGNPVVPFGPICMRGSAAHDPSSVRGRN
jgi:hypothetical protein